MGFGYRKRKADRQAELTAMDNVQLLAAYQTALSKPGEMPPAGLAKNEAVDQILAIEFPYPVQSKELWGVVLGMVIVGFVYVCMAFSCQPPIKSLLLVLGVLGILSGIMIQTRIPGGRWLATTFGLLHFVAAAGSFLGWQTQNTQSASGQGAFIGSILVIAMGLIIAYKVLTQVHNPAALAYQTGKPETRK